MFFTDSFVYFQTHSVYIFRGRHNIGYRTCFQISVWQRLRITNNDLGEQCCPRFPGSTKIQSRAAILFRTHVSDEHFAGRENNSNCFFRAVSLLSHFLTFFPFHTLLATVFFEGGKQQSGLSWEKRNPRGVKDKERCVKKKD